MDRVLKPFGRVASTCCLAAFPLLTLACGNRSTPDDGPSTATEVILEQPSPISVVSSVESDVACYSVVEIDTAVVVPKVCPIEDVSGDVRFEAFAIWKQSGVTVVFITPGLSIESSQHFSRDDEFGWAAFVTAPDGIAKFRLLSGDKVFNCAVSLRAVDCA